ALGVLAAVDESQSKDPTRFPRGGVGLWSEVPFRLRRPLGILTGAIDKLLVTPTNGKGFDIEIIDFKTNRMRTGTANTGTAGVSPAFGSLGTQASTESASPNVSAFTERQGRPRAQYLRSQSQVDQFAFNFEEPIPVEAEPAVETVSVAEQVQIAASDYQLQMQAYALAVHDLLPALAAKGGLIKVTLHFLDPNVEFHLAAALLSRDACARAIDEAMMDIIASHEPVEFPVRPALHCRRCSFLSICRGGRQWLRANMAVRRPHQLRRTADAN
ncbi:MAG TPA: PD-(D/E)XK nuclease family protein, partial [Pyrinomonadaceae bacterium]|nr:PD-(D/E)XK nuclease family protein [Pyrinomonadaceae bacterium]